MSMKISIQPLLFLFLVVFELLSQVKRGRNEGTFNIPATNVAGNGNIFFTGALSGNMRESQLSFEPWAGVKAGLSGVFQLSGKISTVGFERPGTMEAGVQVTTPGNDHLRFFGMSLTGNLYLSTETDTLSGTAITGKPEYNAYTRPVLTLDLDWIAKKPTLPLKTYLTVGLSDNPMLLYRYSQIGLCLGIEFKQENNCYSVDIGTGFYKDKSQIRSAKGASYSQQRIWIEPMVRRRLSDRFSVLVALRALVLQRVNQVSPLEPEYVRFSAALETPVVFKETNSEAIRSMIFTERKKKHERDSDQFEIGKMNEETDSLQITIEGLDLEPTVYEPESEMVRRREEIQQKMKEIEHLLKDVE